MEPINPRLWRIPLSNGSVNAFLLQGEDGLTLVDCGYPNGAPSLLRIIHEEGWAPGDIRQVVITHSDLDHMGSLAEIRAATGAEVLAHDREIDLIEGRTTRQWGSGIRGTLTALAYGGLVRLSQPNLAAALVDRGLADGETLDGGWRVVHTPGHTPGHISLHHPGEGLLLAGDLLGQRRGQIHGPRPWLATDYAEAVASVRKVAQLVPRTVCFGHLKSLPDVDERSLRRLANQLERHYEAVSGPQMTSRQ